MRSPTATSDGDFGRARLGSNPMSKNRFIFTGFIARPQDTHDFDVAYCLRILSMRRPRRRDQRGDG